MALCCFRARLIALSGDDLDLLTTIGSVGAIVALYQLGAHSASWPDPATRHLGLIASCATRSISRRDRDHWIIHTICICVTALLLATQIAFQLRGCTMRNCSGCQLPEYDAYRRNTVRLVPGVIKPRLRSTFYGFPDWVVSFIINTTVIVIIY